MRTFASVPRKKDRFGDYDLGDGWRASRDQHGRWVGFKPLDGDVLNGMLDHLGAYRSLRDVYTAVLWRRRKTKE